MIRKLAKPDQVRPHVRDRYVRLSVSQTPCHTHKSMSVCSVKSAGSFGQGRGATSPRSATYKRQLQSPSLSSSNLQLKLGEGSNFNPLEGRNVVTRMSGVNDIHALASSPAEFSVSGRPAQTCGNRNTLIESSKDTLELISLIGTSPRSASRHPTDLLVSAVSTSPRSLSHQKQRSPRRATARLQEHGNHRVSTPSITGRSQQQSMSLEVQSHSLSPQNPH